MKTQIVAAIGLLMSFKVSAVDDAPRVVMLGVDGLSVDGLQTARTPNIDKLFATGVVSLSTRNVMPSVTLPNWTSHMTGSGPEQHGVDNNGWTLNNIVLPAVVTDKDGYYPSIFKVLREQQKNIKIGYYYNWKELINSINPRYLDEAAFEEEDGYRTNYQKAERFLAENSEKPTLVFLYTVHVDHAGHRHGWMSPEYIQSIEELDTQIGQLIGNLRAQGLFSDTHFMLFSDHGGNDKGHGGMTKQEMETPWAIVGPEIRRGVALETPNNVTNTAPVVCHIFRCSETPEAWVGKVPSSIFVPNEQ